MENNTPPAPKQNYKFYISIFVVLLVVVGAVFLSTKTTPPKNTQVSVEENSLNVNMRPISEDDYILGNRDAEIIIVEYSDTECPYCKRFHADMHKLIDSNSEVAWVYRHSPIPSLHAKAFKEAVASECAAEQGGNDTFWRYVDEIYTRTRSNDSLDEKELYNIASDLDLNTLEFKTCLDSGKYNSKVEADMADASNAGVQGTPTSFVVKNGQIIQKIPGALPYEQLSAYIDSIITE